MLAINQIKTGLQTNLNTTHCKILIWRALKQPQWVSLLSIKVILTSLIIKFISEIGYYIPQTRINSVDPEILIKRDFEAAPMGLRGLHLPQYCGHISLFDYI